MCAHMPVYIHRHMQKSESHLTKITILYVQATCLRTVLCIESRALCCHFSFCTQYQLYYAQCDKHYTLPELLP